MGYKRFYRTFGVKIKLFLLGAMLLLPYGTLWAATVTAQDVYDAAFSYIVNETGYPADQIILEFRSPFPAIEVPDDKKLELSISGEIGLDTIGRLPLQAEIFVDEGLYKTFYPIFEFDRYTPAVVAMRWIKRGEEFTPSNVSLLTVRASSLPTQALDDLRILQGRIAKVSLPKGRVISYNQIEIPPLVEKKQIVNIIAQNATFKAQTRGVALMDGKDGEMIKVKNIDSGRIVYGRVYDENTVIVETP
ncbi:MAG: flagellar basal body P-ring formation protein FlgA [Candidatus Omnitrophica bacterium]|nr:flagellar basal body P-ring formation protein FlgA [Candidatus Omnitrophota bacterium]